MQSTQQNQEPLSSEARENIAENLSRATTHDTPLVTGLNQNIIKEDFRSEGGIANLEMASGRSFPLEGETATGTQAYGTTGQTFTSGQYISGQPYTSQYVSGQYISGQPFTTQQLSSQSFGTPGFQQPIMSTTEKRFEHFPSENVPSQLPIVRENEFLERSVEGGFTNLREVPLAQSQAYVGTSNLAMEQNVSSYQRPYVSTGGVSTVHEEPKKEGFFSKVSHVFTGDKDEHHNIEKLDHRPPGILDEKGTTVSMPQGISSTSQLGLPITGPDYTHGTHGTTQHTVFTGGILSAEQNRGTGFQPGIDNIGPSSNVATVSGQIPVGFQSGYVMQPGFMSYSGYGHPTQGIDLSGTNASHVDRDITLQEGGLLGLRQGAVTGNPGDIITNYETRNEYPEVTTKFIPQPVITQVIEQPVQQTTVTKITTTAPTHLGGECSLIHHHHSQS